MQSGGNSQRDDLRSTSTRYGADHPIPGRNSPLTSWISKRTLVQPYQRGGSASSLSSGFVPGFYGGWRTAGARAGTACLLPGGRGRDGREGFQLTSTTYLPPCLTRQEAELH